MTWCWAAWANASDCFQVFFLIYEYLSISQIIYVITEGSKSASFNSNLLTFQHFNDSVHVLNLFKNHSTIIKLNRRLMTNCEAAMSKINRSLNSTSFPFFPNFAVYINTPRVPMSSPYFTHTKLCPIRCFSSPIFLTKISPELNHLHSQNCLAVSPAKPVLLKTSRSWQTDSVSTLWELRGVQPWSWRLAKGLTQQTWKLNLYLHAATRLPSDLSWCGTYSISISQCFRLTSLTLWHQPLMLWTPFR